MDAQNKRDSKAQGKAQDPDLIERYRTIGISAVAAALPFQSERRDLAPERRAIVPVAETQDS